MIPEPPAIMPILLHLNLAMLSFDFSVSNSPDDKYSLLYHLTHLRKLVSLLHLSNYQYVQSASVSAFNKHIAQYWN